MIGEEIEEYDTPGNCVIWKDIVLIYVRSYIKLQGGY